MKTMFATTQQKRLLLCSMIAAFALTAGMAGAQSPASRISSEVSGSEQTLIKGSQHPLANPANEAGRVPASMRFHNITMTFSRSATQEADLDALLAAQQDPASSQYHRWITSDQFATRFGMAQADLDKVSNWLEQQGFTVDSVNRSRNAIQFSGSVAQVESAFRTQMHYYSNAGEQHFAPSTALSIPAALAPVVSNIRNLNNFQPRAQHTSLRPDFTSGVSGAVFFSPSDIVTAYDIKPLYSGGIDGTGQTIAIMGQSYVNVNDMKAFQSAAGLASKPPSLILVAGTGSDGTLKAGDEGESDIDLEWSNAVAPGANIVFVYTGSDTRFGVYDSAQYAVDEMVGNIISLSYSSCETELTAADFGSGGLDSIFKQAATQGQTVMAASGDSGSTACSPATNLTVAQQQAITVNYPASSAYVTGVGGTAMPASDIGGGANFSTYWNSNGTGGASNDLLNSLKSYVPEIVWNDDSTQSLSATGGGTSTLVPRPSWQSGVPGIPSGSFRLVPDIAFYSSPGFPGYLYCTSDVPSGQAASCGSGFRTSSADTSITVAGGTSFAAPIFAGMVALLNQKLNYTTGQGLVNPTLYKLAANSANYTSGAIHDVTSGNNNCTAGVTFCGTTTGGFSAGTGYDEVTGIGSLDVAKIAALWPANTGASAGLTPTSTTVSASNSAPAAGVNVTFTVTVASSTGVTIPTGNVTLQVDGGTTFGGTTVAAQAVSATGTLTYTASFTASGPHQVLAQYAGDATHAPSVGAADISIATTSSGKGTIALGFSPASLSVTRGSQATETLTVTPAAGYTGTVNLTYSTSNATALTNLCVFASTGFTSAGDLIVSSATTPVTGQITIDTNASDCTSATGGKVSKSGLRMLPRASGSASNHSNVGPISAGLGFASLLFAGMFRRRSRSMLRGLMSLFVLAIVGMALTACGSSNSSSTSVPNPPKGTYTITFSGQDSTTSTITAQQSFTLVIN